MSDQRRSIETERRLRRRQRQVFDGNPGGRSTVARPISPGTVFAGSGSGSGTAVRPAPDLLRWTVSAASVTSGGFDVTFDTATAQLGFGVSAVPASTWTPAFEGITAVNVTVDFAAHVAGATIEIVETLDGAQTVVATEPATVFHGNTFGHATFYIIGYSTRAYGVRLTQSSGVDQTAQVTVECIHFQRNLLKNFPPGGPVPHAELLALVRRSPSNVVHVETFALVSSVDPASVPSVELLALTRRSPSNVAHVEAFALINS